MFLTYLTVHHIHEILSYASAAKVRKHRERGDVTLPCRAVGIWVRVHPAGEGRWIRGDRGVR